MKSRPRGLVLLSLLCSFACEPVGEGDEVGEVTSVDDTADLDGTSTDSTTGTSTDSTSTDSTSTDSTGTDSTGTDSTGTDSTDSTGDPTFEQLCTDGCNHFLECAPTEFGDLYADVAACEAGCESLYGECTQEASEYFYCFLGLQCAQVVTAVTEGPTATECGTAYEAANAACGL